MVTGVVISTDRNVVGTQCLATYDPRLYSDQSQLAVCEQLDRATRVANLTSKYS